MNNDVDLWRGILAVVVLAIAAVWVLLWIAVPFMLHSIKQDARRTRELLEAQAEAQARHREQMDQLLAHAVTVSQQIYGLHQALDRETPAEIQDEA